YVVGGVLAHVVARRIAAAGGGGASVRFVLRVDLLDDHAEGFFKVFALLHRKEAATAIERGVPQIERTLVFVIHLRPHLRAVDKAGKAAVVSEGNLVGGRNDGRSAGPGVGHGAEADGVSHHVGPVGGVVLGVPVFGQVYAANEFGGGCLVIFGDGRYGPCEAGRRLEPLGPALESPI